MQEVSQMVCRLLQGKQKKEMECENRLCISVSLWHSLTDIRYKEQQTKHLTWTMSELKLKVWIARAKKNIVLRLKYRGDKMCIWCGCWCFPISMSLSKSCLSTFVWISLLPNTWKTVLYSTYKKDFALSDKKKKTFHRHTRVFNK